MNFVINDDATIESLISGSYTGVPESHAINLRYPLSYVMSLLYKLTNRVPWYTVMLFLCYGVLLAGVVVLGYRCLLRKTGGTKATDAAGKRGWMRGLGLLVLGLCLIISLVWPQMLQLHYTVATAALSGAVILMTLLGENVLLPAILFPLTFSLRKEIFLLTLPFLLVAYLWRALRGEWKKAIRMAVVTGILSICVLTWQNIAYSYGPWQNVYDYHNARIALYDYHFIEDYETEQAGFEEEGLGYEDYLLVKNYALGLDAKVDGAFLERAERAVSHSEWQEPVGNHTKRVLLKYFNWIFKDHSEPYTYMALGLYVLLLGVLLYQKRLLRAALVVALGLGRSVVWMYLFWQGRFLDRVAMSLFLLELPLLFGMLFDTLGDGVAAPEQVSRKKKWQVILPQALFALLGVLMLVAMGGEVQKAKRLQENQEIGQIQYQAFLDYAAMHPEETYLLDTQIFRNGSNV